MPVKHYFTFVFWQEANKKNRHRALKKKQQKEA